MIEINNIDMSYGQEKVLDGISYKFYPDNIYGLIGKNGAGKTTLLKIMSRLIRKNKGNIIINEDCVNKKDYLKLPMTYISDSPIFYSDLTIREHLLLICNIKGFSKNEAIEKIDFLINLLKLEKYENMFPSALSKGTLQRLNIAIGLIRDESIVLMDEPFITLDPVQVESVENLILELKNKNKTFIISSHDIDSLESICDKYLILRNGKLLEYNPNEINRKDISKIIFDSYGD
ncbi:ABC transporter ATP-binding protein [Streptococcus parauberis]|mgnify:FL=1|uniref:ABC transporter ATP-binding protein n=1 Tax=Streptococcus parauberis TaxID=1348 RepID=UPI0028907997|nr:ABC transporter ATP-binding protein [Streptococcus parauberis]MDT2750278.1 ABC transporter ATP-binding protein [Streptococcus parauberis]